jgi:chromosomal replication initiation ATPase DnaA
MFAHVTTSKLQNASSRLTNVVNDFTVQSIHDTFEFVSVVDGPRASKAQQRLALKQPWPYDRANFIVSHCNAKALDTLDAWPVWPGGKLALIGPEGSGKTHLATLWADRVGALTLDIRSESGASIPPSQPILVENADQGLIEERLFHLLNRADLGQPLLLTARTPPRVWPTTLPDLRSRLNALMVVDLQEPDDIVLGGLLDKFFRERNILPRQSVLDYLLRRIERSAPAALAVVERIDEAAAAENKNITREFVRTLLGESDET